MTEAKIRTACSHCRRQFMVPAAGVGRRVRCPACDEKFVVEALADAGKGETAAGAGEPGAVCVICQHGLDDGEPVTACPRCATSYHQACWEYNHGCGVYGCAEAPPTEGLDALEIPASHWGREEKNCPQCGRVILAAAMRCRHCGATFETAAPQTAGSFHQHAAAVGKAPRLRTASVWLLILAFLPCTAPLIAVAGVPWYLYNREAIACLPGVSRALPLLAVAVAVAQTVMFLIVGLIYGAVA